jgi:hypothetical protein
MPINCKFELSWGLFIALATSVVGMNSLAVGATCPTQLPAPTSVTINVATNPTSYKVGTVNAYRLKLKTCQTVTWTVSTPPNPSGKNPYHVTILFPKETPLFDPNTNLPAYLIVGSDQKPISAMAVDADATGTYEYYVVIVDDFTNQTYPDDPKIIVGTGKDSATANISSALDEVKAARTTVSNKSNKLQERLQEQMESIEKQLRQVLDELNDSK